MATDRVDVTVRIDPGESERLDTIVNDLKARGLSNVERHSRFMIVNGSVNDSDIENLRKVQGVASVRKDQAYKTQSS
jgi:hypothetical protein